MQYLVWMGQSQNFMDDECKHPGLKTHGTKLQPCLLMILSFSLHARTYCHIKISWVQKHRILSNAHYHLSPGVINLKTMINTEALLSLYTLIHA